MSDIFRTEEGTYRILVTQFIDGRVVDWYLVERRTISTPDKLVAHAQAAKAFVGADVEWTGKTTEMGYEFTVSR